MKKTLVYIIALVMLLSLLCGCGTDGNGTSPTASPKVSEMIPGISPDVGNGTVNDNDGIITDNDNNGTTASPDGGVTGGDKTHDTSPEPSIAVPENTAKP